MKKFEYLELIEPKYNGNQKQLEEHLNKIKKYLESNNAINITLDSTKLVKLAYKVKNHAKGLMVVINGDLQNSQNYQFLKKDIGNFKNNNTEILKNIIILIED